MMRRVENWQKPFNEFFAEREKRPFEWGKNDCALFAADCVRAITGEDLAEKWRGRYRTSRGALRRMKKKGVTLEALADAEFFRVPVSMAQRGDVVMHHHDGPFGGALGVVGPGGVQACFAGADGIDLRPVKSCMIAWRV